jgi:hypothetical protein
MNKCTNGTYAWISDEQATTPSKHADLDVLALLVDWIAFLGKNSFRKSVAGMGPTMWPLISSPIFDISFCRYLWFVVNLDTVAIPCLIGVDGGGTSLPELSFMIEESKQLHSRSHHTLVYCRLFI